MIKLQVMHRTVIIFGIALLLGGASLGSGQVLLSEIMAVNVDTVQDEDGDYPDWIELVNTGDTPVNLAGWTLTDNAEILAKWVFPSTVLEPGAFLLVFASSKDRAISGQELHTNFRLDRDGEYLGLRRPNQSVASEFAPTFPALGSNHAYGIPMASTTTAIIDQGDAVTWTVPTDGSTGTNWISRTFEDAGWNTGLNGLGYESNPADYQGLIETTLPGGTVSVYARYPFTLTSESWDTLTLGLKIDDGFVAYLNGVHVASSNAPVQPAYNSVATANHSDNLAVQFMPYDLAAFLDLLQPGTNLLAVHGLNRGASSSDMLVLPRLTLSRTRLLPGEDPGYLTRATPGQGNVDSTFAPLDFSEPSRLFAGTLPVQISTPLTNVDIRYTTNGTDPVASSPMVTGPISLSSRTILKAAIFFPGGGQSQVETRRYQQLQADLLTFDSDLPVVVVDSYGASIPNDGQALTAMHLLEPGADGRTAMTNQTFCGLARFAIRGSSSGSFPKKQYKLELVDEADEEIDANLLEMGKDSDWILYAPGYFDRNMIANNLVFELGERMGQTVMSTRFVEVFLNDDNATISDSDYQGLYVLMESVKRGKDRVDVAKLTAADTTEPRVSGGYVLSVDRTDSNQFSFNFDPNGLLPDNNDANVVSPRNDALVQAQRDYIQAEVRAFVTSLFTPYWEHPTSGYASRMDVDSFIDFHHLHILAMNVDAFRLSGHFYKERNGPLFAGPHWDYDRSLESNDSRDNNPTNLLGGSGGTSFFEWGWYDRLFDSEEFRMRYQDRWYQWRQDRLSTNEIFGLIDEMADEISEAYERPGADPLDENSRWGSQSGYGSRYGDLFGEMEHLKEWLTTRLGAYDHAFGKPPVASPRGGIHPGGATVSLALPGGESGTLYLTLDGTDPRALGGGVAAGAQLYTGPISLSQSTRLVARLQYTSGAEADFPGSRQVAWSASTTESYHIDPFATSNTLAITEVHYHPYPPYGDEEVAGYTNADDFEFIELMNRSSQVLDLSGVAFQEGISFSFDSSEFLRMAPGQRLVLASDEDAFLERYPGAAAVLAGRYSGNLNNQGEDLILQSAEGALIQAITFDDRAPWPEKADGLGHALVVDAGQEGSSAQEHWRASCIFHGSPGAADTADCAEVYINEVLTHTDPPWTDAIELYNPSSISLDLSGYYLSDSTDYLKFSIPPGTVLPPNACVVFDETDFNPNGAWNPSPSGPVDTNHHFALNAVLGDDVYLVAVDASTNLLRVADQVSFRATLNGTTLGCFPEDGAGRLYPLRERALGTLNGPVRVGPVIISEIMYNPNASTNNGDLEFVELTHIGTHPQDLGHWVLDGAVEFEFDPGTLLAPGASLVLVGFDPADSVLLAAFQAEYGSLSPLGPWKGRLDNGGEAIELLRADQPPVEDPTFYPLVEEEYVEYGPAAPWDSLADGTGLSLGRIIDTGFANTPFNWKAQSPSPGTSPWDVWRGAWFTPAEQADPAVSGAGADPDGDDAGNREEYRNGTHPRDRTSRFEVVIDCPAPDSVRLRWMSAPGRYYQGYFSPSLDPSGWSLIPGTGRVGNGSQMSILDADPARTRNVDTGYYRLGTP